jgi:phosphatidylserine/phosphatidylglycerophosphate/cardiolipin synthase-like enzyme
MTVVRVGEIAEAYCGGMDLAFTRRDAPMMHGDWQSGVDLPSPDDQWPGSMSYPTLPRRHAPSEPHEPDLPPEVFSDYRQIWHDQQVKLEGPIVATFEEQFRERWTSPGRALALDSQAGEPPRTQVGQVLFSSPAAIDRGCIVPLDGVEGIAPTGRSIVQMWRTIPWRTSRSASLLVEGEYSAMAGIANASQQATELIWIFDQYFWHRPLARLLNQLLRERPGLRLILVLPPHAGGGSITKPMAREIHHAHHYARRLALDDLTEGMGLQYSEKIGIYNLWQGDKPPGRGIYCHAKSHTYDGSLLVCGTCNLNWRSFSRDTEVSAAVLDPDVVHQHQRHLWNWLFKGAPWPADDHGDELRLDGKGNGARFFECFRQQTVHHSSYLIPDRWYLGSYPLPNGVVRKGGTPIFQDPAELLRGLDPNALPVPVVEHQHFCKSDSSGGASLDQIVTMLESRHRFEGSQLR